MSSLTFYVRHSQNDSSSPGCLCLRFIHERKTKTLSSNYRLLSHEWNQSKQCLNFNNENSDRTNYLQQVSTYLQESKSKFETSILVLAYAGDYTVEDIAFRFCISNEKSLLNIYTDKLVRALHKTGQERTARAYRTVCRGLVAYNGDKDLLLGQITPSLIQSFERHLRENGKSLNTISFYMRNLRAIYHRAIDDHLISEKTKNPFHSVYTGVQVTRKRALNKDELSRLNNLDLLKQKEPNISKSATGLNQTQRYFLFCFHARGMSFVDLAYLQKKNIKGDVLRYFRKKTSQLIEIKITKVMQELIDSFKAEVSNSLYLFPIITDTQKSARLQYESGLRLHNKRLKKLSHLAGICKNVSSHVARHSWATIAKFEKLPLWVISEGLGHSNEKTTYTYLASFERSVLDQANEKIAMAMVRQNAFFVRESMLLPCPK